MRRFRLEVLPFSPARPWRLDVGDLIEYPEMLAIDDPHRTAILLVDGVSR